MQMLGLLTLAMCYGLWTKQSWALRYARLDLVIALFFPPYSFFYRLYLLTAL